jgi:hypothetical protein
MEQGTGPRSFLQLLAGSGPNAGDQTDPGMAPMFDDELELELIPGLEMFQM